MPAKLEGTKSLKRLVKVYGIEGMVEITLTADGIKMRIPGNRKALSAQWAEVAAGLFTPEGCPAWLAGEPTKFLQECVRKSQARKAKREEKE